MKNNLFIFIIVLFLFYGCRSTNHIQTNAEKAFDKLDQEQINQGK